jgi:hypothetical protein
MWHVNTLKIGWKLLDRTHSLNSQLQNVQCLVSVASTFLIDHMTFRGPEMRFEKEGEVGAHR